MNQDEFAVSISNLAIETEKQLKDRSQNIQWQVIGITDGFDAKFKVKAEYGQYTSRLMYNLVLSGRLFDYVRIVNMILDLTVDDLALQVFSPRFMSTDEQLESK